MPSNVQYATYLEFFDRINYDKTITAAEQARANSYLIAASRAIDGWINQWQSGIIAAAGATARRYAGTGSTVQRIDPCVAITLVEVKDSPTDTAYQAWTAADWIPFKGSPVQPNFNDTPYDKIMIDPTGDESIFTNGRYITRSGFRPLPTVSWRRSVPTVRVTARWGLYSAITQVPNVREATIMQASIMWKRLEAEMGITAGTNELGTLDYRGLDPDVELLLMKSRMTYPAIG